MQIKAAQSAAELKEKNDLKQLRTEDEKIADSKLADIKTKLEADEK